MRPTWAYGWYWGIGTAGHTSAVADASSGALLRMPAPTAGGRPASAKATPRAVIATVTGGGDITGEGHDNLVLTWNDPGAPSGIDRNSIEVYDPDGPNALKPVSSMAAPTGPVAVGDFNGDGHADVAAGEPTSVGGGHPGAGAVRFVLLSRAAQWEGPTASSMAR